MWKIMEQHKKILFLWQNCNYGSKQFLQGDVRYCGTGKGGDNIYP